MNPMDKVAAAALRNGATPAKAAPAPASIVVFSR
jgi:hypothetical protein